MDVKKGDDSIILRKAVIKDCEQIFKWRNHESTRRYFFNPEPIMWKAHLDWFEKVLANPSVHLLIGELAGEPVGVLRYDVRGQSAEVSVYVVPVKVGLGLGARLLISGKKWVHENISEILMLKAKICWDNKASLRAFEKAGFRCDVCEFYCDLIGSGKGHASYSPKSS
ncbi:MAG: GNAT family N-acetyltransferase [Candidatus Electrothrix sp. AW2]|nr:GNAT family N-acetyltransferase [Candidatus Electrothrix gigas]